MTESRQEAAEILDGGRAKVRQLLDALEPASLTRPGLGGGDWSPKDLLGHLSSWEEHALEALEAWSRGERASIDRDLHSFGVNSVNAREVEAKSKLTLDEVLQDEEVTHSSLLAALENITDAAWERPATTRGRKSLGHRLGQILGGPGGNFRHVEAHLPSLRAFAEPPAKGG